jgi:PAS domain S-box-containing protein
MKEELSFEQLRKAYADLQLRVTRFSAIEQELINTRDQLDQELELYKRLQKYSTLSLSTNNEEDLLKKTSEAIIDILEIEASVVLFQNQDDESQSRIFAEGFILNESLIPLKGEIIRMAEKCSIINRTVLTSNDLNSSRLLSKFSSAILVHCNETKLGYHVYFFGAITKKNQETYAPIIERQVHVFNIFSYHMQSVLAKIISNKKIEKQMHTIMLSENEMRKLSMIATKTKSGVIISDTFGRIEWVNEAFTKISGYTLDEVVGRKPKDFLQGSDTQLVVKKQLSEALWQKKDIETVVVNHRKDGSAYYNQLEIKSVYDESGNHVNFIAIQKDITDEINHNKEVMMMNSRFNIITESTKMGVWDWNVKSNYITGNEVLSDIFGFSEITGAFDDLSTLWRNNIHPDDKSQVSIKIDELINGESNSVNLYYKMFRGDNKELIYVKSIMIAERNEYGDLIRVIGGSQDVTAEKLMQVKIEKALEERDQSLQRINFMKNFYESILKHSPSQILVFDKNLKLTYSNTESASQSGIWGIFNENAVVSGGEQTDIKENEKVYSSLREAIAEDKMIQIEDSFLNEEGREVHFLRSILPSHDNEGKIENIIVIGVNITELKFAQSDIIFKNEELKKINLELDHFVYSISHDLRSPLLSIKGLTSLVLQSDEISSQNKKMLDMIFTSATRLDYTIQEILEYSRNSRLNVNLVDFDLYEMIKVVFDDLKFVTDAPSVLSINVNGPVMIKSDQARVGVLLKNIIGNSIKYRRQNVPPLLEVSFIQHSDSISITIEDNGEGIDEKHIGRVFDMFYRGTTSSVGTGLGLYICREIVNKIGGKIELESHLGKGTKVYIDLPKQ